MYIYKTTNTLNNKIYIGLSSKLVEKTKSYYGSGKLINQAINKYGKEHFTKEIIERDIEDFDLLCEREIYWIKELKSKVEHGNYNMSDGGEGTVGVYPEAETRKKIGVATTRSNIERWKDPVYRELMVKRANNRSEEYKKKLSAALSAALTGIPKSDGHKQKIAEKAEGTSWWYNPETDKATRTREQMPSPWISKMPDAVRNKIATALTGTSWWYNPETHVSTRTREQMPSPWIRGKKKR